MASKPYSSMQSPADIAAKYGDKAKIGQAVQQGIVDPTVGMLAGMVIDRIRAPQPQAPQGTVAQKVMGGGLGATPEAQQMGMAPSAVAPAPQAAPAQPMMAASGGLMDLPVDDDMFDYAGGGVVAFAAGSPGTTFPRFEDLPIAGGDATVPGNRISQFFSSMGGTERRIDPETGEAVTLGEYLRRLDQRKARAAMPAAQTQATTALQAQPPIAPPVGPGAAPAAPPVAAPQAGPAQPPAAAPAQPPAAAPTPFQLPTKPTPQEFLRDQAAFGVDPELNKKLMEQAEKLGGSAEDKERALAMAIIRGSLGAMAGTSPNAILNVAQGFASGVEQYAKDAKDIRAAERDVGKVKIELLKAEDAQKRNDFKAYREHIDKANDLAINLKKLDYQARSTAADERKTEAYIKSVGKPSQFAEQMAEFRRDPKGFESFRKALGSTDETSEANKAKLALAAIDNALLTMKKDDPQRKVLEQRRAAILQQLTGMGGVVGAGGKTLQWTDIQ